MAPPRVDGVLNLAARFGLSDADASLLLTIVLVAATIYYAIQNWKMATEMHRQTELSTRPFVVASIAKVPGTPDSQPGGELTIRNIGKGAALFVRIDDVLFHETGTDVYVASFTAVDILALGESATATWHVELNGNRADALLNMFWFHVFSIRDYDVQIHYDDIGGQRYVTPMRFGKAGARLMGPPVKEKVT